MKVKCLITEQDVTAGVVYEVISEVEGDFEKFVYVKDNYGQEYPLFKAEFEVVEQ